MCPKLCTPKPPDQTLRSLGYSHARTYIRTQALAHRCIDAQTDTRTHCGYRGRVRESIDTFIRKQFYERIPVTIVLLPKYWLYLTRFRCELACGGDGEKIDGWMGEQIE